MPRARRLAGLPAGAGRLALPEAGPEGGGKEGGGSHLVPVLWRRAQRLPKEGGSCEPGLHEDQLISCPGGLRDVTAPLSVATGLLSEVA